MFVFGYYKQLTFVISRKIQLFYKNNWNKFLGINPMGLSDPKEDSLEIIAFQTVKNW